MTATPAETNDAAPGEDGRRPAEREESQFTALAREVRGGLVAEFWDFLKYEKKWWLLPIIVTLLLFGLVLALGGGAAAPFIYTLF